MKHIITLIFMLLLSGLIRAEQDFIAAVKPVPAPTSFIAVMEITENESLSSNNAKEGLKVLVTALNRDNDLSATIIFYEKRQRSTQGSRTANQIKSYVIKKAGIKSDRIILVNGGYGNNGNNLKIKVYLVPQSIKAT